MAINLKPKPKEPVNPAQPQGQANPQGQSSMGAKPKTGGMSFLKTGKVAQETFAKEELKAEQAQKSKFQRFWMPDGSDTAITFLDGNLADGILDIPFYYEHQMHMNGSWKNWFICTQDEEPCPICEGGHYPSYVGAMTVIDHSEYTSKKDNKVYKDQVRLFVAKKDTIKQLQKLAVKRGGLRGCRFDVSRVGDKAASVGNVFDFTEKLTEDQLKAKYKDTNSPFNYGEILSATYFPAKELRKLGFGSANNPVGGEPDLGAEADYAGQM